MVSGYGGIVRQMRSQASRAQFSGIQPSKALYFGLAAIALLKDLLDFAGIGSLPGIGTVVTLCFSFLIWILMTVFDRSGGKSNKVMGRNLVLLFASLVEAIGFGLNFLPIETLTVIVLYTMARKAAKKEEQRLQKEEQARSLSDQRETYRMQVEVARRMQLEQEELEVTEFQKEAVNDPAPRDNKVKLVV